MANSVTLVSVSLVLLFIVMTASLSGLGGGGGGGGSGTTTGLGAKRTNFLCLTGDDDDDNGWMGFNTNGAVMVAGRNGRIATTARRRRAMAVVYIKIKVQNNKAAHDIQ